MNLIGAVDCSKKMGIMIPAWMSRLLTGRERDESRVAAAHVDCAVDASLAFKVP